MGLTWEVSYYCTVTPYLRYILTLSTHQRNVVSYSSKLEISTSASARIFEKWVRAPIDRSELNDLRGRENPLPGLFITYYLLGGGHLLCYRRNTSYHWFPTVGFSVLMFSSNCHITYDVFDEKDFGLRTKACDLLES